MILAHQHPGQPRHGLVASEVDWRFSQAVDDLGAGQHAGKERGIDRSARAAAVQINQPGELIDARIFSEAPGQLTRTCVSFSKCF